MPSGANLSEAVRRAETIGYDSIWWPDHLMGLFPQSIWTREITEWADGLPSPDVFADPMLLISAAASASASVQLGSAVTDVLRRHPVMLARDAVTLDHLSHGRFILGLGAGEAENLAPYGVPSDRPVSRLEEAIEIMRRLWAADGPVTFPGRFWDLSDAVLGLKPLSGQGHSRLGPPIWLAAHGERMLELTGRLGDGWLPTYSGSVEDWEHGASRVKQAASAVGRDVDDVVLGLWAQVVLGGDEEEVDLYLDTPLLKALQLALPGNAFEKAGCEHPLGSQFSGFREYLPISLDRSEALAAIGQIPVAVARANMLCGTPESVAKELSSFCEAGLQHLVLVNAAYWGDRSAIRRSYALEAELRDLLRDGCGGR